jgi:hypothetical protein
MSKLKIINAGQGAIHEYENTKRKLLLCNANIHFNKQWSHRVQTQNSQQIKNNFSVAKRANQIKGTWWPKQKVETCSPYDKYE